MNKFDFIRGIKCLSTSSSLQEIQKYLLFDMKKLAVLDEGKLCSKQDYFKNTNIILEYKDSKTEAINNWLRYKIATKLNLYTTNSDCDSTDVVKEVLLELLTSDVESICYDEKRGFTINDEIHLETDTMNSFTTTFNVFIRNVLTYIEPDWVENYQKKYDLTKTNGIYRDIYFLENINKWYDMMTKNDKEIFEELQKFAMTSHTIGNCILVPKGYNIGRYSKTSDYWDLTLLDLRKIISEEDCDINYKWYAENYHLLDLDNYYKKKTDEYTIEDNEPILLFKNHSSQHKIPNREEIKDCASNITSYIILRGLNILRKLNSTLIDNESINKYYHDFRYSNTEKIEDYINENTPRLKRARNIIDMSIFFKGDLQEKLYKIIISIIYIVSIISAVSAILIRPLDYLTEYTQTTLEILYCLLMLVMIIGTIPKIDGFKKKILILEAIIFPVLTTFLIILFSNTPPDFMLNYELQMRIKIIYAIIGIWLFSVVVALFMIKFWGNTQQILKMMKSVLFVYIGMPILVSSFGFCIIGLIWVGVYKLWCYFRHIAEGIRTKCSVCGEKFAIQYVDSHQIREEPISIIVENKIMNRDGEITGTQEQCIPGKRIHYRKNYICKYCSHRFYSTYSKEIEA